MEEENNQSATKEVANQVKQQAKKAAKEATKKAIKEAAKQAISSLSSLLGNPYFWAVVGIIVALIILVAGFMYILDKVKNDDTKDSKEVVMNIGGRRI